MAAFLPKTSVQDAGGRKHCEHQIDGNHGAFACSWTLLTALPHAKFQEKPAQH
jgi:hypothetical protein